MIQKKPTITDLQNQAALTRNEVKAIQSQLADTTRNRNLDHARVAEEKDGRDNEK
jgi:hypothetical protein